MSLVALVLATSVQTADVRTGDVDIHYRRSEPRDRLLREAFDASWHGRFDDWQIESGFNVQRRRGDTTAGVTFGNTGGNARAALVQAPIDGVMREWRFGATRMAERSTFRIEGFLGAFDNRAAPATAQDPFGTTVASLAPPPDNKASQFAIAWAWRAPQGWQLNLDAARGRHTQNDLFMPYTLSDAIQITTPLPRASLGGDVVRRSAEARLRVPLKPRLAFDLRVRDEHTDDRTDPALFIYPAGDVIDQPGVASGYARWRLPRDHERRRVDASLQWRAASRDRVRLELGADATERAYAEVGRTDDTHAALEWRRAGERGMHLRVERSRRSAGEYRHDLPWLAQHTDEYIATVAPELRFENHPLLRRFNLADRERNEVRGGVSWNRERWSANALAHYRSDRYPESVFGLTHSNQRAVNLDLGYALDKDQYLTAWIARESGRTRQDGRHFRGGPFFADDFPNAARDWQAATDDRATLAGVSWRHKAPWVGGEVGVDVSRTRTRVDVAVTGGADLITAPLPTVVVDVDRVGLFARHAFNDRLTLRLALDVEWWRAHDWRVEGVTATTVANVLGLADSWPDRRYSWASISVEWR